MSLSPPMPPKEAGALARSTITVVTRHPTRRYGWIARTAGTSKVRTPVRRRAKPKKQDRTPADNEALRARRARSNDLNAALDISVGIVWHEAENLAKRFPEHNVRYYCQLLLQHGKKRRHKRKMTGWNAFLSTRLRAINSGEYSIPCHMSRC